ncbi:MAG: GDSL-type esterase/lipase family protein [candidate division KSB1 bacterium]|nr:GDSL-type esterase/lipase family protein [candidate division KSB1 bacterium]
MPVGNSITAGEHYGYPPVSERTGYRKALYKMLIDSGYHVDFVGSQRHGKLPKDDPNWYDWESESYPGWKIPDIAEKVKIALPEYKPDILLIHVGTNGYDWEQKPEQVMDMLDMINDFSADHDQPVTVFLCKIINRFKGEHGMTTRFNIKVADAVAARTGDEVEIVLVDMEGGAGLDYSDSPPDPNANPPYQGGDMWGETYPGVTFDKYHPNNKGNHRMAVAFFKELVKEFFKIDNTK